MPKKRRDIALVVIEPVEMTVASTGSATSVTAQASLQLTTNNCLIFVLYIPAFSFGLVFVGNTGAAASSPKRCVAGVFAAGKIAIISIRRY